MSVVAERIALVQKILKDKAPRQTVRVCGVVKKQNPESIQQAAESGILDLGVNYVQEGEKFRTVLTKPNIRWHFIGKIQSRKVRYVAEYDVVQSLDRLDLAAALNQQVEPKKKVLPILVQVNIGGEPQKSGIAPPELGQFLERVQAMPFLKPTGLMALPPGLPDVEKRRPYFQQMKQLYDEFKERYPFDTLSMGTSEDYLIAVEEGANFIRLGTLLFGARN